MKILIVHTAIVCVASVFLGCSFPQMEARAKAKALEEKGYHREAKDLEEQANDLPVVDGIGSGKGFHQPEPKYDLRNDPYHFPETKNSKEGQH